MPRYQPDAVVIPATTAYHYTGKDVLLEFDYNNWRGDDHSYVIKVESIEFGPYDKGGGTPRPRDQWSWVVHGDVITRDGEERSDMGPTRRRTFLLSDIKNVKVGS